MNAQGGRPTGIDITALLQRYCEDAHEAERYANRRVAPPYSYSIERKWAVVRRDGKTYCVVNPLTGDVYPPVNRNRTHPRLNAHRGNLQDPDSYRRWLGAGRLRPAWGDDVSKVEKRRRRKPWMPMPNEPGASVPSNRAIIPWRTR